MIWWIAYNGSRGEVLVPRVRRCASFLCRLRGLTFRRRLPSDEGILLVGQRTGRWETSIHMFFVFFPIAVLWLDAEGRVVDKRLARPFRPIYLPRTPARDVLEASPDVLDRVAQGDRIQFVRQEAMR